mmetsp:Transcript_81391/g.217679  ORF Transcript_81391/g.217679 Transcript_81391/m.217679 type:complete len:499 (-) Transcript_81391:9-1505(-)
MSCPTGSLAVETRHDLCGLVEKEFRRLDVLRAHLLERTPHAQLADHHLATLVLRQASKCRPTVPAASAGRGGAAGDNSSQAGDLDPAAKRQKAAVPEPPISSVQELQEMLQDFIDPATSGIKATDGSAACVAELASDAQSQSHFQVPILAALMRSEPKVVSQFMEARHGLGGGIETLLSWLQREVDCHIPDPKKVAAILQALGRGSVTDGRWIASEAMEPVASLARSLTAPAIVKNEVEKLMRVWKKRHAAAANARFGVPDRTKRVQPTLSRRASSRTEAKKAQLPIQIDESAKKAALIRRRLELAQDDEKAAPENCEKVVPTKAQDCAERAREQQVSKARRELAEQAADAQRTFQLQQKALEMERKQQLKRAYHEHDAFQHADIDAVSLGSGSAIDSPRSATGHASGGDFRTHTLTPWEVPPLVLVPINIESDVKDKAQMEKALGLRWSSAACRPQPGDRFQASPAEPDSRASFPKCTEYPAATQLVILQDEMLGAF